MKLRLILLATLGGALLVAGCMDGSSPTDLSPNFAILDAEHGDEGSHFYFLPPMVSDPGATGVFDATQPVVIEICQLIDIGPDCAGAPIAEFSVGAATIDVSLEDEHYLALWHAGDLELDLDKLYRISVFVGTRELGYADVQPVSNGKALKNLDTGEVIGLIDERTLPIKVRIEEGALGITIDGTALTAPMFFLGGPHPFDSEIDSATPVVLALEAGSYTIQDGSGLTVHAFQVTAAGDVAYAAEKEPYLDGAGTSQLTLVGYSVEIDATVLTSGTYFIGGIGGRPSATLGTFTFLPGTKDIQDGTGLGGVHAFEVTETGGIAFAAEKEPFFDGLNTSRLTLVGYDVVIDATVLTASTYFIGGIGGFSSATVETLTFLPGGKTIQDGSGGVHAFQVTEAGLVTYAAEKEPFLDGLNTSQLTLVGYDLIIDATLLVASTFDLGGIGSLSAAELQTVTMLPGTKSFSATDHIFVYDVEVDGLLAYDTSLDGFLAGRNTNVLTVTP